MCDSALADSWRTCKEGWPQRRVHRVIRWFRREEMAGVLKPSDVGLCVYVYVTGYVCMYVGMSVGMYVCMYVCIYV